MSKPVCLIVGAGDYIGAAIAKRFARGGFTVCLARRDASKSSALIKEIQASGGTAHSYSMDAREEGQVIERYDAIETDIGPLEIVISNAGGNVNFPIRETTERVPCGPRGCPTHGAARTRVHFFYRRHSKLKRRQRIRRVFKCQIWIKSTCAVHGTRIRAARIAYCTLDNRLRR